MGAGICICKIRKRGEPPNENPGLYYPLDWEGQPHFAACPAPKGCGAASPLDATAPSYSLLNFKRCSEEQPGGGGFLGSQRLSHAQDCHLLAPSECSLPSRRCHAPATQTCCRAQSSSRGGSVGGAQEGRSVGRGKQMRAPARTPSACAPGEGSGKSLRQPWEIPLPRCAGGVCVRLLWRSAPFPWFQYSRLRTLGDLEREN